MAQLTVVNCPVCIFTLGPRTKQRAPCRSPEISKFIYELGLRASIAAWTRADAQASNFATKQPQAFAVASLAWYTVLPGAVTGPACPQSTTAALGEGVGTAGAGGGWGTVLG